MDLRDYVDLKRKFEEIDSDYSSGDVSSLDRYFNFSDIGDIYWKHLLESEEIIVILGEAGSGKSTEFKYQCERLSNNGSCSFFIELEKLINNDSKNVLEPENEDGFEDWLNGSEMGYFFLDSIDESKFAKRKDFSKAIQNFKRLIGLDNLYRCKILFSSRYSEWHPSIDLDSLKSLTTKNKKVHRKEENKAEVSWPIELEVEEENPDLNKDIKEKIKVFKLIQLNRNQVKKFARHYLGDEVESFIESINLSHAWSMVKRPLDVEGLIQIWKVKGELGSFKDILTFHIKNGLRETNSERKDQDDLTEKKALLGAKCLAAAVILTKKQKFDSLGDVKSVLKDEVLIPIECLPDDWVERDIKFLLQRSVFDPATYSTIKFHLRSVTEFLAAEWFSDRLDSDQDYITIRNILFKEENGSLILKESFKPIVAWLTVGEKPWNKKIRADIISSHPDLFLKYGDPSELPPQYRLAIIEALAEKFSKSNRIYAEDEDRALSRLGDDIFLKKFQEWLGNDDVSESFKYLLLRIASNSNMKGLSQQVLDIAIDTAYSDGIRVIAIDYIGQNKDSEKIQKAIDFIFSRSELNNRIVAAFIQSLFPNFLTVNQLLRMLTKTHAVEKHSLGIGYLFKRHLENISDELSLKKLTVLLNGLVELSKTPPLDGFLPYSKKYYWIGGALIAALDAFLKKRNTDWSVAAKALYHLNAMRYSPITKSELSIEDISEIDTVPEFRREYLWYFINRYEKDRGNDNDRVHLFQIFGGHSAISEPKMEDLEWLIEDARDSNKREKAKKLIQRYWDKFRRPINKSLYYRKKCQDDKDLKSIFSGSIGYYFQRKFQSIKINRLHFHSWGTWKQFKKIDLDRKINSIKEKLIIYSKVISIWRGKNIYLLVHLAWYASEDHAKHSKIDLENVKRKYGRIISFALKSGSKKYWRYFQPELPQKKPNKIDGGTILGFCGITLSIKDKSLDFEHLTSVEAKQLTYYAINELNGFPFWFDELIKYNSHIVIEVFKECIELDWLVEPQQKDIIPFVGKIRTSAVNLIPRLSDYLLTKLLESVPANYIVIKEVLGILIQREEIRDHIIELCKTNLERNDLTRGKRILWLGVLLQLDANNAISLLNAFLGTINQEEEKDFMIGLCASLESREIYGNPSVEEPDYLSPQAFLKWFPLVHRYIDPQDDVLKSGAVTPKMRAQDFRRGLIDRFISTHPERYTDVVDAFIKDSRVNYLKDYFIYQKELKLQNSADQEIWEPSEIPKFMIDHEIDPKSTHDLFQMVLKRLRNIKDEIERSEYGANLSSLINQITSGDDESELRKFLTNELKNRSGGKFSVTPEEELAGENKPDIRIHKAPHDPIGIEIKWAQRWSGRELKDMLKTQLVDKYLNAPTCNYGIYFIGFVNEKDKRDKWKHPETDKLLDKKELIEFLKNEAKLLLKKKFNIDGLIVFDIDFN